MGWEIPTDGRSWTGARYSQPFLDTDELDYCAQLDTIFPFVTACFGEGNERFSEFNLRDTPAGAGSMRMGFHHDAALNNRVQRKPYHPCDWCVIVRPVRRPQLPLLLFMASLSQASQVDAHVSVLRQ